MIATAGDRFLGSNNSATASGVWFAAYSTLAHVWTDYTSKNVDCFCAAFANVDKLDDLDM